MRRVAGLRLRAGVRGAPRGRGCVSARDGARAASARLWVLLRALLQVDSDARLRVLPAHRRRGGRAGRSDHKEGEPNRVDEGAAAEKGGAARAGLSREGAWPTARTSWSPRGRAARALSRVLALPRARRVARVGVTEASGMKAYPPAQAGAERSR